MFTRFWKTFSRNSISFKIWLHHDLCLILEIYQFPLRKKNLKTREAVSAKAIGTSHDFHELK